MDLLQLKYFQTVARHQHITRAANELHVAQPSLSKVISRLERDLGVPLFDRIGRHIKLNKFGKDFLKRVDRIFIELENGKRGFSEMLGNEETDVSIAINNLYPFTFLIEECLLRYPNIRFHQTSGSIAKLTELLIDGCVDFFFCSPPIIGENIETIPLFTEEIFLVVPHGHKFADRTSINLREASNDSFVCMKEGFGIRELTDELCRKAGFKPKISFESEIAMNLIDAVNSKLGIALLPILQWKKHAANIPVTLHITEPISNRTTAVSYIRNRHLSESAKHYLDFIINYFEDIKEEQIVSY